MENFKNFKLKSGIDKTKFEKNIEQLKNKLDEVSSKNKLLSRDTQKCIKISQDLANCFQTIPFEHGNYTSYWRKLHGHDIIDLLLNKNIKQIKSV